MSLIEARAPRMGKLAKAAGMKYMVLTSRHHEGFSLWDSNQPYNSVNYGPRRDIVAICRRLPRIRSADEATPRLWTGTIPTPGNAHMTTAAHHDYIEALNTELLTNYGKIDILWYDVSLPMDHWEGWDSVLAQ